MSGLKNSPFGKRLRASHREPPSTTAAATDDDLTAFRTTSPFNPIFGISSTPSLSLDSSSTLIENRDNGGFESPTKDLRGSPKRQRFLGGGIGMGGMGMIVREYGDRFVPSKDSGDLRTSYHLMEEGGSGPSTPSKSRIIPSESDALKGEYPLSLIYTEKLTNL
jgi:cell division cycle 20-like protein 1, cofactor of APC complex